MFTISEIRERLNELTFEQGLRRIEVGRVSELQDELGHEQAAEQMRKLGEELQRQDLQLQPDGKDPDRLFVVQELKRREVDPKWTADAVAWVSRITTVALEMALPAAIGYYLDQRWGTRFLAIVGFVVGLPLGLWHLLKMTAPRKSGKQE